MGAFGKNAPRGVPDKVVIVNIPGEYRSRVILKGLDLRLRTLTSTTDVPGLSSEGMVKVIEETLE